MNKEIDDQALRLAKIHYFLEEGITQIYQIKRDLEIVTLLEVNFDTIPVGIMPIQFGSNLSSGYKYPSVILEITPDEFEKIKTNELKLPEGWQLGELIPRGIEENNV